MPANSRETRPDLGPGNAPVPVVVVGQWMDTFAVPSDLERSMDPGPGWVVPGGVVVGAALIAATWTTVSTSDWRPVVALAGLAFVAAWAFLALAIGGTRTDGLAYSVATAAWMLGAWSLTIGMGAPWLIAAAVTSIGAVGQLVVALRARRLAIRRRAAVRGVGDEGVRTDGWIVGFAGAPWQRELTIEAADGTGRTWSAEHCAWRDLRPTIGYPVGIWSTSGGNAVLVLAPRVTPNV
ncbi:hypothetical protein [Cellulomonas sp. P5_C6]